MRWIHGMRARLRLLARRSAEARMDEELRFHIEMETEKNQRAGMSAEEARRRALLDFGGMEGHREAIRDERTFAWAGGLSLDLKLGVRMMRKHPGLTVVGGFGMAVAVAIGVGGFGFVSAVIDPSPPLPEGERLVSIQHSTGSPGYPNRRLLHDFVEWREELRSIDPLAAFQPVEQNLITGEGPPERVAVAEITASGFHAARVAPLLGRYLLPEDELHGAPPVVVIGHDVWQRRFDGDPQIVGRTIQLGSTPRTVVGVMPAGFAFPVRQDFWTPLPLDPTGYERGDGPVLFVFGRLAAGHSMAEARAELRAIGQRTSADFPESHGNLRPQVMPYTYPFAGAESPLTAWGFQLARLIGSLLLVVVAVNVAILVYARTAMRQDEIAVRTALGASRRRVVTQLFLEALVLAGLAAAAGLGLAGMAMKRFQALAERTGAELPFWIDLGLTPGAVAYAAGLALLCAVVVGVVPALQATGGSVQHHLRQLSSGGSATRLGRTWMALIVTQVAMAVAVLPPALYFAFTWSGPGLADPGAGAEPFLTARLLVPSETPSGAGGDGDEGWTTERYAASVAEVVRRLQAEPGISGVTATRGTPGVEWESHLEVYGAPDAAGSTEKTSTSVHRVRRGEVDLGFMQAFDVRLQAGRSFGAADLDTTSRAVLVNGSFVREVLDGGSAVGRRIRPAALAGPAGGAEVEPERWLEIVGVVSDFPHNPVDPSTTSARIYEPLRPGSMYPAGITMRVSGPSPPAFGGRLREITADVDPTIILDELQPLAEILREERERKRFTAVVITAVMLSVLFLSAAGIYALMSFAVTRRQREIGIRSALGANPRLILRSVFSRAVAQLGAGAAVGLVFSLVLDRAAGGALMGGTGSLLLLAVVAVITLVGTLAALGPARRALRIEPMEALRGDG
jgi:putative ABC transport system permease protein